MSNNMADGFDNEFDELDTFANPVSAETVEAKWDKIQEQMAAGTFEPTPLLAQWHIIESPYRQGMTLPPKLYDAVMFGDTPCTICSGTGRIDIIEQKEGVQRPNTKPCPADWRREEKLKAIQRLLPTRYQRMNLSTLEPSPNSRLSLERQAKIIQYLKDRLEENPYTGFFIYGTPGSSKTTFATTLVRKALERDWESMNTGNGWYYTPTWIQYLNWDVYIQSLLDYQNHPDEAVAPTLSPTLIRVNSKKGNKTTLVIEEVDKSRLTEFKANKLFELVCAVDETESQLIITTNHRSEESFQAWLYQTDNEAINTTGEAVWRRIVDNCKMIPCKGKEKGISVTK